MRQARKAMKTMLVVAMAALIGITAWAGSPKEDSVERRVIVCMQKGGDARVVEMAQVIASRMFARISVNL
jgi:hypothetical protein